MADSLAIALFIGAIVGTKSSNTAGSTRLDGKASGLYISKYRPGGLNGWCDTGIFWAISHYFTMKRESPVGDWFDGDCVLSQPSLLKQQTIRRSLCFFPLIVNAIRQVILSGAGDQGRALRLMTSE
jgi:hypothetical protein